MDELEKYKKMALDKIAEKKIKEMELWKNLPHFEKPEDVPHIPFVNSEEYKTFYIPKLIDAGAIPKHELIDGTIYIGNHRRAKRARWNKERDVFEYWRRKYQWNIDECNHFEDDNGFALFVPLKIDPDQNFDIPEK